MAGMLAGTIFDRPPQCERCDLPEEQCVCPPPASEKPSRLPPAMQTARLSIEKRKRGKTVTLIQGLAAADNDLQELLRKLKSHCGAGGCLQDETMEIQGNQLERLKPELKKIGFRVKG
jgi:translation initiation factor 1